MKRATLETGHNVMSASVTLTERYNEVDIPNIVTNQSPVLTRRNSRLSLTHVHLDTSPLSHDTHVIPEFLQIPPLAINHVLAKIKLCMDALGDKREFHKNINHPH